MSLKKYTATEAMVAYVKAMREVLFMLLNLDRVLRGLPPLRQELEEELDIKLPKPADFFDVNIREREIEAIRKAIKRRRKLSAEDLWEILRLRNQERLSWSQIAKKFRISVRAATKGYKKHKKH